MNDDNAIKYILNYSIDYYKIFKEEHNLNKY